MKFFNEFTSRETLVKWLFDKSNIACFLNINSVARGYILLKLLFTFNASIGQAMWVYTSETIPSSGMTIIAFVNMLTTVIFGAFTNYFIMLLGSVGFFFTLGVTQIFSFCFIYISSQKIKLVILVLLLSLNADVFNYSGSSFNQWK